MRRRRFLCCGLRAAAAGTLVCSTAQSRRACAHAGDATADGGETTAASGPLKPHPNNPRYFADGRGRAVLLVGAHTWNNLVDMGRQDPPEPFDFGAYVRFLRRYGHNFIRLWTWDCTTWNTRANGRWGKDFVHNVAPHPWRRTGPGKALDGKPKFDLTQFDETYFHRLRERVRTAGRLGIYVSVMLFEGWALFHANTRRGVPAGWAWRSHPFHPANNINGIDAGTPGDPLRGRPHSLAHPQVNAVQKRYIQHVVDTVNEFDNVLYEVINEGGEKEWDWWVVRTVHEYERTKPKQHPVGLTGHGAERLPDMLASPCDWVSPGSRDGYRDHPPAWNETKVSLLDTDHVWGIGGHREWVWRSFLRGHNPLFMDPYDGSVLGKPFDRQWEPIRRALGHVRRLSQQVDLARMAPRDPLASSGYCLAAPGEEYLVLAPEGKPVTVDLRAARGSLRVRWVDCASGRLAAASANVDGGTHRAFTPPKRSDMVLWLTKSGRDQRRRR
ncbi:MAG: hypothetical protein D6725_08470 [Planctomycetota bacterium]|nr:MAG: hypothetical protein D6725_08470 [Planctomycetota bacterium]